MALRKIITMLVAALLLLALVPASSAQDEELTEVSIVLKWVTQAQFAGYYAARELGYYEEEGLAVDIVAAGVDINPIQLVAAGEAEFGIGWMGGFLAARDAGEDIVSIAQIYQRSAMRQITFVDSGVESVEDWEGRTVGVWPGDNRLPTDAAIASAGLDPDFDVEIVGQAFDMNGFINGEIDVASAMTYNELAQVLETVAEDGTFPVYTLDDLTVIDFNEIGTAMLEDNIFARADWLAEEGNEEVATAFLRASFRGWAHCRDMPDDCVEWVLAEGSALGEGHQRWMMNEVNKVIWPSGDGIGITSADLFDQSMNVALDTGFINEASEGEGVAYRNDLAQAALDGLMEDFPELDLMGMDYEAPEVEITPNGE